MPSRDKAVRDKNRTHSPLLGFGLLASPPPPPQNHPMGAFQQPPPVNYWSTPNVHPIGLSGSGLQISSAHPSAFGTSDGMISNPTSSPPVARHPRAVQQLRPNPQNQRYKRTGDEKDSSLSRVPKKSRSDMDARHQEHAKPAACEEGLVLGPAGSRPALYASLCLLFGRIPGNSAPGTTNLWNSSHNKLGGRKAHTSLSSADMHTVSCRFSLCAVELPASCAGAAVRAPASHGPTSPSSASPR